MTQQEIQNRNEQIALMLGLKPLQRPYLGAYHPTHDTHNSTFYHERIEGELWYVYPQYDSDWNWLMEAVEFIEKLKYLVEISGSHEWQFCAIVRTDTDDVVARIGYYEKTFTKKEAVFIAVSDFAKLYNNKQL